MATRTQRIQLAADGTIGAVPLEKTSRILRRPAHTWQLRTRPWQIQPCFLAPVLPGETLDSAQIQARVITDPIVNDLLGWWCEYYVFYVTLRQLVADDSVIENFFTDPATSLSSLNSAAKTETYHYASSIDFAQLCLDAVVPHYFREEGEAAQLLGNLPQAAAFSPTDRWTDSLVVDDGSGTLPSAQGDLPPSFDPEVISGYEEAYARMIQLRMVDMTFEEYLRQQGVNMPGADQPDRPELIRYFRDFQYPGRVIDPTSGNASAAVSWRMEGKIDAKRFFKEPGFLFAVTVARPKVYMAKQRGAAAHMLDTVAGWMPALWDSEPYMSMRGYAAGAGPLDSLAGYWADVKDLYHYGDQFLNFAATAADGQSVALPLTAATPTLGKKYVASADVDALFTGSTAATRLVRQDGVAQFRIKSRLRETT